MGVDGDRLRGFVPARASSLAREASPVDDEATLDTLASFGRAAAPYLQKAAPGAIQGAVTGFSVGGPMGAVAGAGLGAAGSLIGGPPASAPPSMGSGVNPAAAQLLALLSRPEVIAALSAMAQGAAAPSTVPVAGVPVPVSQFANLVQSLADEAASIHHARTGGRTHRVWEDYRAASAHPQPLLGLLSAGANAVRGSARQDDNEFDDDPADLDDLLDAYYLGGL